MNSKYARLFFLLKVLKFVLDFAQEKLFKFFKVNKHAWTLEMERLF